MTKPVTPLLTVDAIIIYEGKLVLIKRKNEPHKGMYALPGGFMDIGETIEAAVVREAKEETSLDVEIIKMVGIYSEPTRDSRGHTVSVCYLVRGHGTPKAASDAKELELFDVTNIPKEMAFDHSEMIERAKYLTYGLYFCI